MSDFEQDSAEAVRNGKSAVASAKDAAKSALNDASQKAHDVADRIKDSGSRAASYMRDEYNHLSDEAGAAYSRAKDKAYGWEQSAEGFVKDRPMQALLIAAGVGALLALLWRRND